MSRVISTPVGVLDPYTETNKYLVQADEPVGFQISFQNDPPALAYAWGWYWGLSSLTVGRNVQLKYYLVEVIIGDHPELDSDLIRMGYDDARATYELQ